MNFSELHILITLFPLYPLHYLLKQILQHIILLDPLFL